MNFGYDFIKNTHTHGILIHGPYTPRKSRINVFTNWYITHFRCWQKWAKLGESNLQVFAGRKTHSELSEIRSPPRMSIVRMLKPGGSQISCAWESSERLVEIQCLPPLLIKNFSSKGTYPLTTFSLFLIHWIPWHCQSSKSTDIFNKELGFMLDSQRILKFPKNILKSCTLTLYDILSFATQLSDVRNNLLVFIFV